jgi:Topoisomerase IA
MTDRLYIAEKREVAAAMAEAFEGKPIKPLMGAYHTREGVVTWLSGHLLELTKPEDHNPDYKRWQINHLPLQYPVQHVPIQRGKNHLAYVLTAIEKADVLVNAGDPTPKGNVWWMKSLNTPMQPTSRVYASSLMTITRRPF